MYALVHALEKEGARTTHYICLESQEGGRRRGELRVSVRIGFRLFPRFSVFWICCERSTLKLIRVLVYYCCTLRWRMASTIIHTDSRTNRTRRAEGVTDYSSSIPTAVGMEPGCGLYKRHYAKGVDYSIPHDHEKVFFERAPIVKRRA